MDGQWLPRQPIQFEGESFALRAPIVITPAAGPTRSTFGASSTPTLASIIPAGSGKAYVAIAWRANVTLSSATINGQPAAIEKTVVNTAGTDTGVAIISYPLGANGSAVDVGLTFSGSVSAVSYRVWRANGAPAKTADGQFNTSAAAATVTTTMDVDGALLAVAANIVQGTAFAWTNATEDGDADHTDYRFSTAVRTGAAFSGTVTADAATDQYAMVTVSIR